MERCHEKGGLNWLSCSLFVISFLRVILQEYGIGVDIGFILIADDIYQQRLFREAYCKGSCGNGIKTEVKSYKKFPGHNFCVGIATLDSATIDQVNRFLGATEFFPVLVTANVLPSELREGYYLFKIKDRDITYMSDKNFATHVSELKAFLINNIEQVCSVLEQIDTAADMDYCRKVKHKELLKMFVAVSEVYRLYNRTEYSEHYEEMFRKVYIQESLRRIHKINEFAEGIDVSESVTEALFKSVDDGYLKIACYVDDVEADAYQQFGIGTALIYDEEYYYFSEAGLRVICTPLLERMSWLELKKMMANKDIIEREDSGFTVKKTIYVEGESKRPRVITVKKTSIISDTRTEMLEEYIHENGGEQNE